MLDLFKSGQVWIGIWSDGRIEWAKQQGVAIVGVIPKEGIFALVTTVNVIKGRPNSELAQRYVNHLLDPESGLQMARALNYFPTNKEAKLPPEVQAKMVLSGSTINQVKMADWCYLVSVYNQWSERWDKEIVR
jgi:putative spermidine/putrescine transport system substrate-binding protein